LFPAPWQNGVNRLLAENPLKRCNMNLFKSLTTSRCIKDKAYHQRHKGIIWLVVLEPA
jgi:hypothetical protein